jgi:hypothetical protein
MSCQAPITDEAANDFYNRLLAAQGADGCEVDEVETNKFQMVVTWKLRDRALPAAEVVRDECAQEGAIAGATLAIRVPEPLRAACPATVSAAVGIVRTTSFGQPVVGWHGSPLLAVAVASAVAFAVVAFNVAMVTRHRSVG